MKKMRIIFLDFDDIRNPLLGAGQAKATYEVATRLVQKGHSVTVISSRYPRSKDRLESGIYYRHIGLGSKNIRLNNFFYIFAVPFIVRKLRADIIVECFTAPVTTLLSPLFTKIPVVALPTSFDAGRFSELYHLPFWLIERFGCRAYNYFIALTPFLDKKMKGYNPDVISRLIPQGVSKEYFSIAHKKPEYILFLGRLDINQKGLDLLLSSYAKVAKTISYPLVIAGDGPDKLKVKKLIGGLGLSKNVRVVGFANEQKKIELLSKAAFVAFPSRNEGFSLVSLETLASGNRLVSFDVPSLKWAKPEVIRRVKAFDITKYAQSLLAESKWSKSHSAQRVCRSFARNFSWEQVSIQFENFFLDILTKKII